MILPLTHERMTVQRFPWVTIGIIGVNFIVFLATWPQAKADYTRLEEATQELEAYVEEHPAVLERDCERCPENVEFQSRLGRWDQIQSEHIFSRYGYVPARPSAGGLLGTLFLHAGFWHLFGNMYILWLCGCSIEDIWGRPLYAVVYFLGGAGAALAHASFQPESTAHLVGASGAVAALMGVFCVRCWNTNIRFFYWFFVALMGTFVAPAWIMLVLWLTEELFYAFVFGGSSTVAFGAHIGGFGFGAAFAFAMRLTRLEENVIAPAIERKMNLVAGDPKLAGALESINRGDYSSAIASLKLALREHGDDPEVHHLLARCYQVLEKTHDAARHLRQELAVHIRRRELDLVAETYEELINTLPAVELTAKELSTVASALMASGNESEAAALYQRVMTTADELNQRLRAGVALATFHHQQGRSRKGLSLLDELSPLAASHPEWESLIEEKRQAFRSASVR